MNEVQTADANSAAGSSPVAGNELETEGLISTVETPVQSGADTTVADAADAKQAQPGDDLKGQKEDKPEVTADDKLPFHQHPRFKELTSQNAAMRQELAQLRELVQRQTQQEPQLDFVPLQNLDDEKLAEWETNDKRGLYANLLRQARYELLGEIQSLDSRKNFNQSIASTFQRFAQENQGDPKHGIPGFEELWQAGVLQQYMNRNPGYNAMNAYNDIVRDKVKARDEALMREKLTADIRAKGAAGSVTQSTVGSRAVDAVDPELQDPDKYGGAKAVAIRRYIKRMRGAA